MHSNSSFSPLPMCNFLEQFRPFCLFVTLTCLIKCQSQTLNSKADFMFFWQTNVQDFWTWYPISWLSICFFNLFIFWILIYVNNIFLQAAEVAHSLFCMCYKFNLQVENATNLLLLAEIHKVQYYIYHTICLEPRGLGLTFRPSPKAYTYTKQCLSGEKETKEIRLTIVSTIV